MGNCYNRKDIAMGQFKTGGKVGRPQKRFSLDTMKHEGTETKQAEVAEHKSGHKDMACGGKVRGKKK